MEIKIMRKIDKTGRVIIPKDVRKTLDLKSNDDIEITVENNSIILKKRRHGNDN